MSDNPDLNGAFERYGLRLNPYRRCVLDPLKNVEHHEWFVDVDGFTKRKAIKEVISQSVENKAPSFFLIIGRSGVGRSSLANDLFATYCQASKIEPSRFFVPRRDKRADHFEPAALFETWFLSLSNDLTNEEHALDLGNVAKRLEDLPAKLKRLEPQPLAATCLPVARDVARVLATHKSPAGLGACFEDVRDPKLVEVVLDMFEGVRTICVMTVLDHADGRECARIFERHPAANKRLIELKPLSPDEAATAIESRWQLASAAAPPFQSQWLRRYFESGPQRPVGRVMTLLSTALGFKIRELTNQGADERLPLSFEEAEILALLSTAEELVESGI